MKEPELGPKFPLACHDHATHGGVHIPREGRSEMLAFMFMYRWATTIVEYFASDEKAKQLSSNMASFVDIMVQPESATFLAMILDVRHSDEGQTSTGKKKSSGFLFTPQEMQNIRRWLQLPFTRTEEDGVHVVSCCFPCPSRALSKWWDGTSFPNTLMSDIYRAFMNAQSRRRIDDSEHARHVRIRSLRTLLFNVINHGNKEVEAKPYAGIVQFGWCHLRPHWRLGPECHVVSCLNWQKPPASIGPISE